MNINRHLDFTSHIDQVKKQVNIRLFAIKKIYYLSAEVKLQFLKTFVLPYFDYCFTLAIYYSRANLAQLEKLYNFCIFKFLKLKLKYSSINEQTAALRPFRLQAFKTRLYVKVGMLVHGIFHRRLLGAFCDRVSANSSKYVLRSKRRFIRPIAKTKTGERRLLSVFVRSIDTIWNNSINLSSKQFYESLIANFSVYFPKFAEVLNL